MKTLKNRLAALEGVTKAGWVKAHRVIQSIGRTRDQALTEYGPEKIGPDDLIIIRRIVAPERRV